MKKYEQIFQYKQDLPEDVVFVMDISPSMDETDFNPSRLGGAIKAAKRLLDIKKKTHAEDRVGIVGFCAREKVIHQLVEVRGNLTSLKRSISSVETDDWTNIKAGLLAAKKLLKPRSLNGGSRPDFLRRLLFKHEPNTTPLGERRKRILLLSDGDFNRGGDPRPVARDLHNAAVVIDVIGIAGSRESAGFREEVLMEIASERNDGSGFRKFYFITDTAELIQRFEKLAGHLKRIEG